MPLNNIFKHFHFPCDNIKIALNETGHFKLAYWKQEKRSKLRYSHLLLKRILSTFTYSYYLALILNTYIIYRNHHAKKGKMKVKWREKRLATLITSLIKATKSVCRDFAASDFFPVRHKT